MRGGGLRLRIGARESARVTLAAAVATVVAVGTACSSDTPGASDHGSRGGLADTAGRLVIVGGALEADNAPVWQAVLEGRDGEGPVCVIPTASGSPETAMASAVEALDRHGGTGSALGVLIVEGDSARVHDPTSGTTLEACSGFWFTGGQQSRIVETFSPGGASTPALDAIRRRFEGGAVVAGTSAGAAIMSQRMISGGSSAEALQEGIRATDEDDGVGIRDGLGFFPTGVVDQHFLARGRIGRLIVAVVEDPAIEVGFGIDENTAMVVEGPRARVVGASGIVVVDGRRGDSESVVLFLAGSGDVIDLGTLEVTHEPSKRPLPAGDAPFTDQDILERWAFLEALWTFSTRLDVGMVAEFGGRVVRLEKGDGFSAVVDTTGAQGPGGVPLGFAAGPVRLEIEPR